MYTEDVNKWIILHCDGCAYTCWCWFCVSVSPVDLHSNPSDEITYQTCYCQVLHRCVFVLNFPLWGSDIFTDIISFTVIAASLRYSLMWSAIRELNRGGEMWRQNKLAFCWSAMSAKQNHWPKPTSVKVNKVNHSLKLVCVKVRNIFNEREDWQGMNNYDQSMVGAAIKEHEARS